MATLRLGSRGSQLALWQANHIAALLREQGHTTSIEIIRTTGDKVLDVALAKVGTKGMFTKEIEEALLDGQIDLAVHSLKDLPTELSPEFAIAAIPKREDPRDLFLSSRYGSLHDLPRGARIGTSSLRRQAQLLAIRNDLEIVPLRGNVDTRLRKLESGAFDAIILASAGVARLRLSAPVQQPLSADEMCPAAGQGALAVEVRSADDATLAALRFLDHAPSRVAVGCERALLNTLGGGCQVPIGALAEPHEDGLMLRAAVADPRGGEIILEQRAGSNPEQLGREVAQTLLRRGAREILDRVYGKEASVPQQP
ncbi:MAG TPA: hydroxymethylbilane synthase [Terriglobales bacterium]|nr:hydroxymethylbilane synthase [Terriglobales bacterium]